MKKKVKGRRDSGSRQEVGVADWASFASLPKCPHRKSNTPLLKTNSKGVWAPSGPYPDPVPSLSPAWDTELFVLPLTSCGISDTSSLFLWSSGLAIRLKGLIDLPPSWMTWVQPPRPILWKDKTNPHSCKLSSDLRADLGACVPRHRQNKWMW